MSITYKNRAQSAGELIPFMYKWPLREKKRQEKKEKKPVGRKDSHSRSGRNGALLYRKNASFYSAVFFCVI